MLYNCFPELRSNENGLI